MFFIQVHSFVAIDGEALDQLSFELPVFRENGNGVNVRVFALQQLEDYCARIGTEKL